MIEKTDLKFTNVPLSVLSRPTRVSARSEGSATGIQWTWEYDAKGEALRGYSFNLWWGCVNVSQACELCWARTVAHRRGVGWGPSARRHFLKDDNRKKLAGINRRAIREGRRIRVFPVDMGDWLEDLRSYRYKNPAHEWHGTGHPDADRLDIEREWLIEAFKTNDALDYLTLTTRPQNLVKLVGKSGLLDDLNNVWIGVTTEDQKCFDERWNYIRDLPNILFLSVEPMRGRIVLPQSFLDLGGRGWVIAGGESGPKDKVRPYALEDWRHLRDQCVEAGVPVFHKQLGVMPTLAGKVVPSKRHGGEPSEWLKEDRIRQWPR